MFLRKSFRRLKNIFTLNNILGSNTQRMENKVHEQFIRKKLWFICFLFCFHFFSLRLANKKKLRSPLMADEERILNKIVVNSDLNFYFDQKATKVYLTCSSRFISSPTFTIRTNLDFILGKFQFIYFLLIKLCFTLKLQINLMHLMKCNQEVTNKFHVS